MIRADLVDEIVAHARRDHPDEACGVIAGPEGSDRPERFIPMLNAARSPTFYEFDSGDLLRLYRDMDARDEVPVVIYHSHTATEAYPSRTDISYASEPEAHYVLVSTREPGDARVPVVPDRRRRGHRGRRRGRGDLHVRAHRRGRRSRTTPDVSSASRPTTEPPGASAMAVTVSIPTILRTHTGGEKTVEAKGEHRRRGDRRPRVPAHRHRAAADHERQPAPLRQHLRRRRGRPVRRWPGRAGGRELDRHDPARRRGRLR